MQANYGRIIWGKGLIVDTIFNKNNLKQIIATIDFEASKFNDYLNYVFFFHEIQFDDECNFD